MDLHHLFQINKINEGLHNCQTHNSIITGLVQTFISQLKKHVELLLEIESKPFLGIRIVLKVDNHGSDL
jgi:hypothetical protein